MVGKERSREMSSSQPPKTIVAQTSSVTSSSSSHSHITRHHRRLPDISTKRARNAPTARTLETHTRAHHHSQVSGEISVARSSSTTILFRYLCEPAFSLLASGCALAALAAGPKTPVLSGRAGGIRDGILSTKEDDEGDKMAEKLAALF